MNEMKALIAKLSILTLVVGSVTLFLGCETMDDNPVAAGAIIGGVGGGATGAAVDDGNRVRGGAVGAGVGAAAGAGAGYLYKDHQEDKHGSDDDDDNWNDDDD